MKPSARSTPPRVPAFRSCCTPSGLNRAPLLFLLRITLLKHYSLVLHWLCLGGIARIVLSRAMCWLQRSFPRHTFLSRIVVIARNFASSMSFLRRSPSRLPRCIVRSRPCKRAVTHEPNHESSHLSRNPLVQQCMRSHRLYRYRRLWNRLCRQSQRRSQARSSIEAVLHHACYGYSDQQLPRLPR